MICDGGQQIDNVDIGVAPAPMSIYINLQNWHIMSQMFTK